jgi:DNA-binding transcriptional MerR regulator
MWDAPMTDTLMTIREMCDSFAVTPRTLRFYESKELLSPIRQGQKRLYTNRDRGRLTLILRGKRFGFSLEELRQLLDLYDGGRGRELQLTRTLEASHARLAALRAEREQLDASIGELEGHIHGIERMLESLRTPQAAE